MRRFLLSLLLAAAFLLPQYEVAEANPGFAFVAYRGTANNKTAGTAISMSPTSNLSIGALIVVRTVSDNPVGASGVTNYHFLADSKNNGWTKLREHTNSPGSAAGDGVVVAVFVGKLTFAITTTDTITLTLPSVTSKAIAADEYSMDPTKLISAAGANSAIGTGTAPSVTLSDLASANYLWIGHVGIEGPNGDTFTQDTDYADNTSIGTTGGNAATNVASRFGDRVLTGSTDTYNPTLGSSRDWAVLLVVVQEVEPHSSGLNFFANEIDKTPGSYASWQDVDVSGDGVPAGATGVILRLVGSTTAHTLIAVRKNGSTDTRTPYVVQGTHTGAMVGIDANRIFEAYVGAAGPKIYLIGYTTDGTDFFTNSLMRTPTVYDSWEDVDVSADIPEGAVGVIVELVTLATGSSSCGARANGSTDTFTYGIVYDYSNAHAYQVVGVDANRVFEAQADSANVRLWLIGYVMAPVSFEVNAVSYALGTTGAWADIAVTGGNSPADADGAIWFVKETSSGSGNRAGGVRKNGSGDESYANIQKDAVTASLGACYFFGTGLDASRLAEGKISNVSIDHYVIGYAKPAGGAPPTTKHYGFIF